ncbi:MAG: hypothetical protein K8R79_10340 [Calditrichales bacterium]|nr:hypothetical protein [Calditrichales bacterium]
MKIELNTQQKERYEFDIALAGVARHDLAEFRLIMIFKDYQIGVQGKYDNGITSFVIPALNDYITGIENKSTLPFYIEFIYEEYLTRIYENEFAIINLPEAKIEKLTHIKTEVEEAKQEPIKIDEVIQVKEKSKFAKSFEIYIEEKKQE